MSENKNSLTGDPSKTLSLASKDRAPKFVRSKDRCHIINRTPIYDAKGQVIAYKFRYTAGESGFEPDKLEKKHVKHILIGFYIRRHMDQFTQTDYFACAELPLTQDITKFHKPIPANRFILHLQDRQESSASFQHQINFLKRNAMTIAADAYTIVYTNWFRELRSISYVVIDMTLDIEEQFILAKDIVKVAPWIKIIADRCDNLNIAAIAFEAGANYVCCPDFSKDIMKANFSPYCYKAMKSNYDRVSKVLLELLEDRPNYHEFLDLMASRPDLKISIKTILNFFEENSNPDYVFVDLNTSYLDITTDVLHKLICFVCLIIFEEYFKPSNEKTKYLSFEPVKQVLVRAKFVEELLTFKAGSLDVSWAFSVGVCSSMKALYAYLTPAVNDNLNSIDVALEHLYSSEPDFETAVKLCRSLEQLDLEYIDGVMATDTFTRHDILNAYENALTWTSSLVELISKMRY